MRQSHDYARHFIKRTMIAIEKLSTDRQSTAAYSHMDDSCNANVTQCNNKSVDVDVNATMSLSNSIEI